MTSLASQSSQLRPTQEEAVGKGESPLRRKRELGFTPGRQGFEFCRSVPALLWAGLAVLNV